MYAAEVSRPPGDFSGKQENLYEIKFDKAGDAERLHRNSSNKRNAVISLKANNKEPYLHWEVAGSVISLPHVVFQ